MPVEVIAKKKTEPTTASCQKQLVPLRVTHVGVEKTYEDEITVGDIVIWLPGWRSNAMVFNATKSLVLSHNIVERFKCVRAYDVAQIVICNDDEPAPVL